MVKLAVGVTATYSLYQGSTKVGYRIEQGHVKYDITREDYELFLSDLELNNLIYEALNAPKVQLVERGTLLVPEGLPDAGELSYSDLMVSQGYLQFTNTDTELKIKYNMYNKQIFNNELPVLVPVEWSKRMTRGAGLCKTRQVTSKHPVKGFIIGEYTHTVVMGVKYHENNPTEVEDTLVHEMIHVKLPEEIHGAQFHREMNRINREWGMSLTVYAEGEVEPTPVKYVYTCEKCNKNYNRRRRLDVTTHYCGVSGCKGRLYQSL